MPVSTLHYLWPSAPAGSPSRWASDLPAATSADAGSGTAGGITDCRFSMLDLHSFNPILPCHATTRAVGHLAGIHATRVPTLARRTETGVLYYRFDGVVLYTRHEPPTMPGQGVEHGREFRVAEYACHLALSWTPSLGANHTQPVTAVGLHRRPGCASLQGEPGLCAMRDACLFLARLRAPRASAG